MAHELRAVHVEAWQTRVRVPAVLRVLGTLKRYNVRGRFFLLGSWAKANPSMVRQIKKAGQYVENHTSTHKILSHASTRTAKS